MNASSPRVALAALLFTSISCATGSTTGGAETLVVVTDEAGAVLTGEISVFSRRAEDRCETDDSPCGVRVPGGFYAMGFRKARPTRFSSGIGGATGGDRYTGCLRARVKLTPGMKITCKKTQEFNCARGAYDTMECGEATAARYGYKPKAQSDETEPGAVDQTQAPVSGESLVAPKKEVPSPPPAPPAVPK